MTDWTTNAAEQICYRHALVVREGAGVKPDVASVNGIIAIIAAHAAPLVALLREARQEHSKEGETHCCQKTWYPHERCNCGADAWNARIDEVLK